MNIRSKYVGIVVALPEERRAAVQIMQQVRRNNINGIMLFSGLIQDIPVCVAEAGMGGAAASTATRQLIDSFAPLLIISAGFCGAVRHGASVADIVLMSRLFTADRDGVKEQQPASERMLLPSLSCLKSDSGQAIWHGSFITTAEILSKDAVSDMLPESVETPVLEMETAAVAAVSAEAGIPFAAVRTVSDDASEVLSFTLDEITDSNFRISILRVLITCMKKPPIIPQLFRLAKNSAMAGKSLADALSKMIPAILPAPLDAESDKVSSATGTNHNLQGWS